MKAASRHGSAVLKIFLLLLASCFGLTAQIRLIDAPAFAAGGAGVRAVATGDLNGDHKPDIVVLNTTDNTIGVLLGLGHGKYSVVRTFATGVQPAAMVLADFNHDGHLDIAVSNFIDSSVSILLGVGDGSFLNRTDYAVGDRPSTIAANDFNGDGNLDLLVNGASVVLLRGKGDGKFTASQTNLNGGASLAVADLNGDGKLDVVVSIAGNIKVSLGKKNGFQAAKSFPGTVFGGSLAIADFTGDGKLDIVAADQADSFGLFFRGHGDGKFDAGSAFFVLSGNRAVLAADFNGDGKVDLVAVASVGLQLMFGNGDGSFQPPLFYDPGTQPFGAAVDDMNRDHQPDLVIACDSNQSTVAVLLGKANGAFLAARTFPSLWTAHLATGDFNGDHKTDLVLASGGPHPGGFDIVLSNGDGTFRYAWRVTPPSITLLKAVAVGDFNNDGKLDVIVSGHNDDILVVMLGNGDGTLAPPVNYDFGVAPTTIATGDFDGDGNLDLAVNMDGGIGVLRGNGDGTFQAPTIWGPVSFPTQIGVADLNEDGKLDLYSSDAGDDTISVLLGNGHGSFAAPHTFPAGSFPISVTAGDFNHDGHLDLAVADLNASTMSVLLGKGDGTFKPTVSYSSPSPNWFVATVDLDGDGNLDLVTAQAAAPIAVFPGLGDGTFLPPVQFRTGGSDIAIGFFNHDRKPDLGVANGLGLTVLLNNSK